MIELLQMFNDNKRSTHIIGGVTIGDNAGIGAGSVVVHSVDSNTVVAGNPAKPLYIRG